MFKKHLCQIHNNWSGSCTEVQVQQSLLHRGEGADSLRRVHFTEKRGSISLVILLGDISLAREFYSGGTKNVGRHRETGSGLELATRKMVLQFYHAL